MYQWCVQSCNISNDSVNIGATSLGHKFATHMTLVGNMLVTGCQQFVVCMCFGFGLVFMSVTGCQCKFVSSCGIGSGFGLGIG